MSGTLSDYRCTWEEAWAIRAMFDMYLSFHAGVSLVGSAGRKNKPDFGDVDLIVTPKEGMEDSVTIDLSKIFGQKRTFPAQFQGIIGKTQVDIFMSTPETFAATYLFYMLPRSLQFAVRAIANAKGLKFGPKGLKKRGTDEVIPTPDLDSFWSTIGIPEFTQTEMAQAESYKIEDENV